MSDEFFDGLVLGRSNAFKRKNQEEIELREQHQQLVAEYKSLEEQNRELRAMIKGDGAVMKKLKNALQMVDPKNALVFVEERKRIYFEAFEQAKKDPNL